VGLSTSYGLHNGWGLEAEYLNSIYNFQRVVDDLSPSLSCPSQFQIRQVLPKMTGDEAFHWFTIGMHCT
jgi:hypothetical protein